MKLIYTLTLSAFLCACAASGVQVSETAATQFKEGVTTEEQLVSVLGKPSSVTIMSGKRFLAYAGAQYQIKGASFIPIVGLFAGGADVQVTSAVYTFSNGVLEQISYTRAESNARTGAQPAPASAQEPRSIQK